MRADLLTVPPERELPPAELRRRKRHLIAEAQAALVARKAGFPRVRLIATAVAFASAVVLATVAFGVVRPVASWLVGVRDVDSPVPTAQDVVIASGGPAPSWRIVATPSDQGLCLALLTHVNGDRIALPSCGYSDIRGDLPRDIRGNPAAKCIASPTTLVPCAALPRHWIGPVGDTGGNFPDRIFSFGPLAEGVASVDLELSDGQSVRAHLVRRPQGLDAPLNFYWAAWPCGSSCGTELPGPTVELAIARDSAGRVLERRAPAWNGNPLGNPNGPRRPGGVR